jgi:hypothetical protein
VPVVKPLGLPRVVADLRRWTADPLRAAGLFVAAGLLKAVLRTDNPMTNPRRQIEAVNRQIARNGLPSAVVLAVYGAEVRVFPATAANGRNGSTACRSGGPVCAP